MKGVEKVDAKLEAKLEELAVKLAKDTGCITFKIAPTHVGLPDRAVIGPDGHIMLVELKTETGHLRPAQRVWIERARVLGAPVFVLYGEQQLRDFFDNVSVTPDALSEFRPVAQHTYRRDLVRGEGGLLGMLVRDLERAEAHAGLTPTTFLTVKVDAELA